MQDVRWIAKHADLGVRLSGGQCLDEGRTQRAPCLRYRLSHCVHALGAAAELSEPTAIEQLVAVTLDGLRPSAGR
jgi:hypothetical protein